MSFNSGYSMRGLTGHSYTGILKSLQDFQESYIGAEGNWDANIMPTLKYKLKDTCFKYVKTHRINVEIQCESFYAVGATLLCIDMDDASCRLITLARHSERSTIWHCMATECNDKLRSDTKCIGWTKVRNETEEKARLLCISWGTNGLETAKQRFLPIKGRKTWWRNTESTRLLKFLPFHLW